MKSRFAPSPTGYLHIGGARTALFSYLLARGQGGKFLLRIEDTDLMRSSAHSTRAILDAMEWLGLDYNGEVVYQTARFERYREIIRQLLENGKAYYCECSKERLDSLRKTLIAQGKKPKYDGKCRYKKLTTGAVRFKNPRSGSVCFLDLVRAQVCVENSELDDLIIARSDGSPTYNLCVVVDDFDMKIDYVIRGDDHISNTPRQINLYQALGWPLPHFAHLAMILGADGKRLSKRHTALSVMAYKEAGFLPDALVNYLLRLGFAQGDKEIFSRTEMLSAFQLLGLSRASASFDENKLLWFNQHYIKHSTNEVLWQHLKYHLKKNNIDIRGGADILRVIELLKMRTKTLKEMAQACRLFYEDFSSFDEKMTQKYFHTQSYEILKTLLKKFTHLENWHQDRINKIIQLVCSDYGVGFAKVAQPLRLALSGSGVSPSIDITTELIGKTHTLSRLLRATSFIEKSVLKVK